MDGKPLVEFGFSELVIAISAIGALGTAAFALVDAFKTLPYGGPSYIGYWKIERVLEGFATVLERALPEGEWRGAIRAHWINGRPRGEQKAIVKSLIRLGLAPDTAPALATSLHVAPEALTAVAEKLLAGTPLEERDVNVLGRLDASIEAYLDAAFDRADQLYRNWSRVLAGTAAVLLALAANYFLGTERSGPAFLVGLLAVPFAPIAKDLASSLQAAALAVRSVKGRP